MRNSITQKAKNASKVAVSATLDAMNKEDIKAAVKEFAKNSAARNVSIAIPNGARCVLASINQDGRAVVTAVSNTQSVLDIEKDIFSHLNEGFYSDEFLMKLRDFCSSKLEARYAARKTGGFYIPNPHGQGFAIINDFNPVIGRVEVTP